MKARHLLTLALTLFALPCFAQQVEFSRIWARKITDLGFTLECEALNVFENKIGISCKPSVQTLLGIQERPVPVEALKEAYSLQRSVTGPARPLLRTAEFQVLEADVSLHMRSGALALIYLGCDKQEIDHPRYLYVLVKTALAPQVSSL